MVSKLLLAVGESIKKTDSEQIELKILKQLKSHYQAIQRGIGPHKSPKKYGSFPFDPYSHIPLMAGVQQPGMTGQVKEDIINRFFELGIMIKNGKLIINPMLLNKDEFIQSDSSVQNECPHLSFTYCSIPFFYLLDGMEGIDIINSDGETIHENGFTLTHSISQFIFSRDLHIQRIVVHLKDL